MLHSELAFCARRVSEQASKPGAAQLTGQPASQASHVTGNALSQPRNRPSLPVRAFVTPSHRSISAESVAGCSTAVASVRSRPVSSAATSMAAARTASSRLRRDSTCQGHICKSVSLMGS